jgi:hypothetical protein
MQIRKITDLHILFTNQGNQWNYKHHQKHLQQ